MVDTHLGRFLDRLEASGRLEDTIVIITSDHGTKLGNHGEIEKRGPVYEEVGHVPLMVRVPGVMPGRRSGIIQPADYMPTILELVGLPIPEGRQGRSFAKSITEDVDEGRTVAVSGFAIDVASASDPQGTTLTVQDERWCLIDRPDEDSRELYDKDADRSEEQNVIREHPEEADRLHSALVAFLAEHGGHPALIRWFDTGEKGDLTGYQSRPPYLAHYTEYFNMLLRDEMFDQNP